MSRGAILSIEECRQLSQRIAARCTGGGEYTAILHARQSGTATWARNRLSLLGETSDTRLQITRVLNGASGFASTSRIDDDGLVDVVHSAERSLRETDEVPGHFAVPPLDTPTASPALWSQSTIAVSAGTRSHLARTMIAPAEAHSLISAGHLELGATGRAVMRSNGEVQYYPMTYAQASVTVRDAQGTMSGWAGQNDHELTRINLATLAEEATEKCLQSRNPRAIEPGRYTVILEPQAAHDLLAPMLEAVGFGGVENPVFIRAWAEQGIGPFAATPGNTRIGQRVMDRRLTLQADPMDLEGGFAPFNDNGEPYRAITWIDRGVLRDLSYDRFYAVRAMGTARPLPNSLSFRLQGDGPTTTVEEMIASTERGILVTRFSTVDVADLGSLLCTGFTRDGLWLIEQGKISHPVKNFRFTESPLFAFNQLEAFSTPHRVFCPPFARLVPAMKVRDFSFTSLADAI